MENIGVALGRVRERVGAAAIRAGRVAGDIELIAVSKTVDASVVQLAVDAGVRDLGENRVQEAEAKIARISGDVRWHLIGRLQSNKARRAASLFDSIHSVDRPELAARLAAACADAGRTPAIYVQVEYVRGSQSEADAEAQAFRTCAAVAESEHLRLAGLMTLPPFAADPEAARPWFRRLVALRDRIRQDEGLPLDGLSMGMSNDFEVAIEEGSTAVRVGSAIFGARQ